MRLLRPDTVRRCFRADKGYHVLSADYDQIELRIAATLAGEQSLIDAAKRGESLHKSGAIKMFGENHTADQYRYMKNLNFGWLFGGGAATLARQTGLLISQTKPLITEYENTFKALSAFKRANQQAVLRTALDGLSYRQYQIMRKRLYDYRYGTPQYQGQREAINRFLANKMGYVVTPSGRRLWVEAHKAYKATNYIVQETARHLFCIGFLRVMNDSELEPTVLLPIHDELLGQARISKAEHIAQRYGEVMSQTFQGTPITASGKVYGPTWGHGYVEKE